MTELNIDIAYCILNEVASCDLYVFNIILRVIIVQSRYIVDALIVVCVCGVCVIELCRQMTCVLLIIMFELLLNYVTFSI